MAKIRLGDTAPNFKAQTSEGKIDFYKFLGNRWGVLFSHPAYFTSISTTELGSKAKLKYEFEKRNVKVIALSVDSLENQQQWIIDLNESKRTEENFIIITVQNRKISKLYDFIRPNASATETESYVMIIAPDKTVKRIITYPAITEKRFK
jgi:alkyl hydroperoxide reductase subunit AhpC